MSSLPNSAPSLRLIQDERTTYDTSGGFTMIPEAVRKLNNGYALAVYEAIARHANKNGECWPSLETICNNTGWSKPHIIKTINTLCEHGIIEKERRYANGMNASTLYRISANVRLSTTITKHETSFTQAVNQVYSGGQPGLHKQEPVELQPVEQEPPYIPPKGGGYSDDFEEFWTKYPKGHGSKKASFAHWKRMSAKDRADALAVLPAFAKGTNWRKGFIKDCERWLRDRLWENPPEPDPEAVDVYDLWMKGAAKEPPRMGGYR